MTRPHIPAWMRDRDLIKSITDGFMTVGCDDCHGGPTCRCADGHTDTTDCTCSPQGGDSR